jgi:alkylation response protein AidB-like acyl-CoA dehydrogenase
MPVRIWTERGSSCGPPRTHSGSGTVAAAGNAVRAGIGAADAITAARAAVVWKGEHSQAPAHLEKVGGEKGRKAAPQLRRLLPLKNRAEYDPEPISATEAKAAVTAAARMVRIAEQTVKQVERCTLWSVVPRSVSIPTLSLQLGGTGWIRDDSIPNRPRSAHWRRRAGPPELSTQIYEGTNQIQRVVIARKLLG